MNKKDEYKATHKSKFKVIIGNHAYFTDKIPVDSKIGNANCLYIVDSQGKVIRFNGSFIIEEQ